MCEQPCFFSNRGICSGDILALYDLRFDDISNSCFPGVSSPIEIFLLGDDRFYENRPSLRSTFVCVAHRQKLLKEYRPSSYKKCWLCLSLKKPFPVRFLLDFLSYSCTIIFFYLIERI